MADKQALAKRFFAPDLEQYIDGEPGAGFMEWLERTADSMASAKTPDELAYAKLLRAVMVAIIESANSAVRDGSDHLMITLFVPRVAVTAAATAVMSVMKEETPTEKVREIILSQLDFVLPLLAPGNTIGGHTDG